MVLEYFIPEIPFYINKLCIIPYAAPGSTELANSIIQAAASYDLILLHLPLTVQIVHG